ncbi:Ig-like domain-containing protein [candidate division KSB1 bacterium]|nr:Ig-like domain-containing protein [candidate division KSB1 bacterium]
MNTSKISASIKKIILLIGSCLSLFQYNLFAQQSPAYVTATDYTVWAVGANGKILKSIDSGENWIWQSSPVTDDLYSVCFIDADTGWAVGGDTPLAGHYGFILFTDDGGVNWEIQDETTRTLHDVFFIDGNIGWTVGIEGINLKTSNGGRTWTYYGPPQNYSFSVKFIDANTGWIAGFDGIYKTTDGGEFDWVRQNSSMWNAATFADANHGWAVGSNGKLMGTTNGGTDWITQSSGTDKNLTSIFFISTNIGWATGESGTIIKTTDGGTGWSSQNAGTTSLNSVYFIDSNIGWAVGNSGKILKTTNGGTNWIFKNSGTSEILYAITSYIPDLEPPYTSDHYPAKNAANVALDTDISMKLSDDFKGVKKSSVEMKVNGNAVSPSFSGTINEYIITYNPPSDFNYNQTITVAIDAEDNVGNKMNTDFYSFSTVTDKNSPYTSEHNPEKYEQNVNIATNIEFHIKDDISGVNSSSIVLKVNDSDESYTIFGTSENYTITYDPASDFGYNEKIYVSIEAEDNAGNKMNPDNYYFTTVSPENIAPDAPTLNSPINNSYINDYTPQLKWSIPDDSNGDTLHFKIELDNDNNWANIDYVISSKEDITGFSPTPPFIQGSGLASYTSQSVLTEGDWWWQVIAWDGLVYGSYSDKNKFTLDITKPFTSNHEPAQNAQNVAVKTNIIVHIKDNISGVKQSQIVMKVNQARVSPVITGSNSDYTLTHNPANDFENNQTVIVSIDGEDNAGNIMDTDSYSFTTIASDQIKPEISHTAITTANSGQNLTVNATITDNFSIEACSLYYRQGGELDFQSSPMSNTGGDIFSANIPASYITERGTEYYFIATDPSDNHTDFPNVSLPQMKPQVVRVHSANLTYSKTTPAEAYRMISVPINLDSPAPQDVLEDDWGRYDDTQWRLLRYVNGEYKEYTIHENFDEFLPGNGFWLITRTPKGITVGSGYSVTTSQNYQIILQPGWNQIGNPYAFIVGWSDVQKSQDVENFLVSYFGTSNSSSGYDYTQTQLEPWQGYFVKNNSTSSTTIEIPPKASSGGLEKKIANLLVPKNFQDNEWGIQIIAECDHFIDKDNYLGCLTDAFDTFDLHDFSEAPFFDKYVSLYFPHDDWLKYPGLYTGDFRSIADKGQYWDFHLKTNIPNSEVRLTLADIQNLPADWDIKLIDRASNVSLNFRDKPAYAFYSGKEETTREFRIIVGQANFVDENDMDFLASPQEFELAQNYPNPFNPETRFRYTLASPSWVKIVVYNMMGQQIQTLIDSRQNAGRYQISWNGRDSNGEAAASGIYMVKLMAGSFVAMRKIALIK